MVVLKKHKFRNAGVSCALQERAHVMVPIPRRSRKRTLWHTTHRTKRQEVPRRHEKKDFLSESPVS